MKKNHISIVLIFLLGLKITAQEKIIKQQSGHCYLAGDEHMPCILKKYDKNGKIILDENNNYAISVKYTYDKKGREILKEAMYGETSSETKTVYSKNEIVKIERSPYYFNKIVIYNDDNGYILSKTVYYSSNYEKRIEEHTFKYKNTEYLVKHTIKTKYLEKGTHYKEIYDIAEKEIIEELEGLKAVKKTKLSINYNYDARQNVTEKFQIDEISNKKLNNEIYEYKRYNKENKIVKHTFFNDTVKSYVINYKYEALKEIVERTDFQYQCTPKGRVITETKSGSVAIYDENRKLVSKKETKTSGEKIDYYYENGLLKKEIYINKEGEQYETVVYDYEFW